MRHTLKVVCIVCTMGLLFCFAFWFARGHTGSSTAAPTAMAPAAPNPAAAAPTQCNFVLAGDFGANDLKKLIVQWGGKIEDRLTINTDFVVLGDRPAQLTGAAQYDQVLAAARTLQIPVMNTTRLVYFLSHARRNSTTLQ